MIGEMDPEPVHIDRGIPGEEGADPDAAVGGLLPQEGQILAVIPDAAGALETRAVDNIARIVAQGIIIAVSILGKAGADMHIREKRAGRSFPVGVSFRGETGGHGHGADGFSILIDGEGLLPLIDEDAVMAVGGIGDELLCLDIAGGFVAVGMAPGVNQAPGSVVMDDFQPLGGAAQGARGV